MNQKELEIYIHIPFCIKKCSYCDFLSGPATEQTVESYMAALFCPKSKGSPVNIGIAEWCQCLLVEERRLRLTGEQMGKLMACIRRHFSLDPAAEITTEVNPGTVSEEKLRTFRKAGINRLSIGMQSAQDEELRELGRIHDFAGFLEAYEAAVQAGYTNINVDVMSGLPGQTLESLRDTLGKLLALRPMPQHVSAYSLIVEEGTPFARMAERGELQLPEEDTERAMYEETREILAKYGFHRYEISNYARDGYECLHNVGYWIRRDYLGFGIGAASLVDNVRFQNGRDLITYLENPQDCREEEQVLTEQEQMEETMFLGLRLIRGISYEQFEKQYGRSLPEVYGPGDHAEYCRRLTPGIHRGVRGEISGTYGKGTGCKQLCDGTVFILRSVRTDRHLWTEQHIK